MKNLFDVTGKSVVVTGSSRGIGLAIARNFLAAGASVIVNGLDPDDTAAAVAQLGSADRVRGVHGDVSTPDVGAELVAAAAAAFGRLDHFVCNAGIDTIKSAVDYTPDEWDRILDVNLRGAFLPAQAAARHWIAAGAGGSVTMTSSIAGSVGIPMLAPYAASKGGVNQLVRTLAAEWAEHAIRVNAVAPGYLDNIMAGVTAHDAGASDGRIAAFTPLRRRATVDEIAAPFVFLASDAASYVTGSILAVDGGYTAT